MEQAFPNRSSAMESPCPTSKGLWVMCRLYRREDRAWHADHHLLECSGLIMPYTEKPVGLRVGWTDEEIEQGAPEGGGGFGGGGAQMDDILAAMFAQRQGSFGGGGGFSGGGGFPFSAGARGF